MIGPVFNLELLVGTRRGKLEMIGRCYAGWLILQFWLLVAVPLSAPHPGGVGTEMFRRSFGGYLETLVQQHFFLMFVVTPVFVSGAIADEKSRGTLQICCSPSSAPGRSWRASCSVGCARSHIWL